jgi:hypothetical protein
MSIKAHLEQAIRSLEAEKQTVANAKKEEVTREKIIPFNQEIDRAREQAIAEKQQALNATILAQQEQFAKEKQAMIEAGEKKKSENANAVITSETYSVTVEYDKAIAKLNEQIANLKE